MHLNFFFTEKNETTHRESNMSTHILLTLFIKRVEEKPRNLSLFRNKFDRFNNTGARMLQYVLS